MSTLQRGIRLPLIGTDFFARRDLLLLLVQKELKIKYKGAALGFLWSLLNPILMTIVYSVVFELIARFSVENYPLFLLAGLMPWNAFVIGVTSSTTAILSNSHLVSRIRFPLEFLPLTSVLANLVNLLPSFVVLVALAVLLRQPLGAPLLALPLLLVLQTVLSCGIALILSAVTVYFRDVEYLVAIGMTVWFFVTPILYPLSTVHSGKFHTLVLLNPMTWLMESYQRIWHQNAWPDPHFVLALTGAAALFAVIGIVVFKRLQDRLAEEL